MGTILQKIRDRINGYKTYIVEVISILTASLAWSGGEITDMEFLGVLWIAFSIVFLRSGNKNDVATQTEVNVEVLADAYDRGFDAGQEK